MHDNPSVDRRLLIDFLKDLDREFAREGSIYLIGETSQVFEDMRSWTTQIELCARISEPEKERFSLIAGNLRNRLGVPVFLESPADVIPLPPGHESRRRKVREPGLLEHLELLHFDPYSVALRFIARGDEPDYHMILTFLDHGWLDMEELDRTVTALLPAFTSETIQQDPAEFRRKYKGLKQMRRALRPGTVHRSTMV